MAAPVDLHCRSCDWRSREVRGSLLVFGVPGCFSARTRPSPFRPFALRLRYTFGCGGLSGSGHGCHCTGVSATRALLVALSCARRPRGGGAVCGHLPLRAACSPRLSCAVTASGSSRRPLKRLPRFESVLWPWPSGFSLIAPLAVVAARVRYCVVCASLTSPTKGALGTFAALILRLRPAVALAVSCCQMSQLMLPRSRRGR